MKIIIFIGQLQHFFCNNLAEQVGLICFSPPKKKKLEVFSLVSLQSQKHKYYIQKHRGWFEEKLRNNG